MLWEYVKYYTLDSGEPCTSDVSPSVKLICIFNRSGVIIQEFNSNLFIKSFVEYLRRPPCYVSDHLHDLKVRY